MKDDDVSACEDQRERFWADYHAAYEAIWADPAALAEFQPEADLWDSTSADGLELVEDCPGPIPDQT